MMSAGRSRLAVSIAGIIGLVLVDHGPWNRPVVESPLWSRTATPRRQPRPLGATVTRPTESRQWNQPRRGQSPLNPRRPIRERAIALVRPEASSSVRRVRSMPLLIFK